MKSLVSGLGLVVLACLLLRWLSPDREIVTHIDIDAPAAQVWSVLIDGAAYPEWNPFMTRMDGQIVVGRSISILLRSGPDGSVRIAPTILAVDPRRELRWIGRLAVPGLFDGEHYFLLSPTTDGRTRLVHGEHFRGVVPWLIGVERYRENFEAMNLALARRAESGVPRHERKRR